MARTEFVIHKRYFVKDQGWKHEELPVQADLETAWRIASDHARELDTTYGTDHFWTVDLAAPDGGSYVQLFHGRLS